MINERNDNAEFNGRNERESMRQESHEERRSAEGEISKTENDLSLGNSVRNFGEVSGSSFGAESNSAKFSSLGQQEGATNESNPVESSGRDGQNSGNNRQDNSSLNQAKNNSISSDGGFNRSSGNDGGSV